MKVWYLDHSAVAVKTEKHLLLFDLAGKALSGQPGEGLAEGCVSPDEIKDEDVLVFVSHEHKDHFDPAIFSLREKLSRVRFVLPEELDEVYQADLFVSAEEEQCKHYALPDCRITTFASTDIGVAYLLETDGLRIYHAGDLNWWHWAEEDLAWNRNMEANFKRYAEPLRGRRVDLAMLPLDSRLKTGGYLGPNYFLNLMEVRRFLPMHQWEDFDFTDEFLSVYPQFAPITVKIHRDGEFLGEL